MQPVSPWLHSGSCGIYYSFAYIFIMAVALTLASAVYLRKSFFLQPHSGLCGLCNYFPVHHDSSQCGLSNHFSLQFHSDPLGPRNALCSRPHPHSGYSTVYNLMYPSDSVRNNLILTIENHGTRTALGLIRLIIIIMI